MDYPVNVIVHEGKLTVMPSNPRAPQAGRSARQIYGLSAQRPRATVLCHLGTSSATRSLTLRRFRGLRLKPRSEFVVKLATVYERQRVRLVCLRMASVQILSHNVA